MNASNILRYSTLLATCILAVNCWGAPFQNGSFESPALAPGSSQTLSAGSTLITGWTASNTGQLDFANGPAAGVNPVDGSQHIGFNGGNMPPGGTISQTFSTTVGQAYAVNFYVARVGPSGGTMSLQAEVKSSTEAVLGSDTAVAPDSAGYGAVQTFSFVATTTNSTLKFTDTSLSTAGVDVWLDNVSVTPVSECIEPPSGSISWWPGNGNANDLAGTNNATLIGGISFTNGMVGQAFSFDGVNDSVSFGNTVGNFGTNDFTIEYWIKTTSTRIEPVLGKWGNCGLSSFFAMRLQPGKISMEMASDGSGNNFNSRASNRSINDGIYHHVAVVRQTTNITMYLDGVLDYSNSTAGITVINNSANLLAGSGPCIGVDGTQPFTGQLDEVAMYNRALTGAEIQSIYNAGSAGKCPPPASSTCVTTPFGLVSWWQAESNALDSADGNNGVLVNGAAFAAGKVGQGFSLDGVNDFVSFADPPSLRLTNLTIEGWFNFAAVGGPRILVAKTAGAAYESYLLFANGGDIVAGVGNTAGGVTTLLQYNLNPVLGTWYHIAYTFDDAANYHALYIDGVLRASGANNTTIGYDAHPVTVGAEFENGATNFFFGGQIDEVALYNRALSTNEIQSIYNAGSAGKCPASLTCVPPPSGLISWWRGEGNANDAADGNNGVWVNGATFAPGKVGQAFNFGGTNHVEVPASSNLNVQSLTIEAWIFPADVSLLKPIVEFGAPAGSPGLHLWHSVGGDGNPAPGSLYANVGDAFGPYKFATSAGVIPSNQWTHVALTFDQTSGIARLLVNGSILATTNFGSIAPATSLPVNLGYRSWIGGTHFVGKMDEMSIYNRALAASEIQALFDSGSAGKCPPQPILSLSISPVAGFYTNAVTVAINAVNAGTNATVRYTLDGTAPSTNSPIYSAAFTVTNTATVSARAFVNAAPASEIAATTFRFWSASSGCVAPAGAISWWTGDGTTEDVLALNPGVMGGNATFAPGFIGQAFSFGAEGDVITVANSPSLQLQNFTIEAWAKRRSTNQASLGVYGNGTFLAYGSGGYAFGIFDDGRLLLTRVGVSFVASTTTVTDTNWHHVAVTRSGTNVSFYIDGLGGGNANYSTTFTFGSNAAIGATGDNLVASFYGLIDEIAIYNRALSTNEVQTLFSAGANGKCPAFGPTIITQPQNRAVSAGGSATFSVLSGGSPPLSYQWSFNGTAIANATNQTFAIANVQSTNAGNYIVTVSNAFGSATSSPATLTINSRPVITQQPQSQTVMAGSAATFTVGVTGSPPLTYQWRRNGILVPGASSPTLVINNVQGQNAGSYTVRIANFLGSVTSEPATLTVGSGQFSVVSVGANGVQLTVQGEAGANYTIEVSSDLSNPANWQPLATLLNNPQNWQFTDMTAPGVSQRFYRLLKSP